MISVCIATYNGERYIGDQLTSILSQLSDADEIVISDDGSMDGTLQVIKEICDKRIKIYHHHKQKAKFDIDYATHNYENALLHAKGDVIFLSDQDDVWRDGKMEQMLKELQTYDVVMSDCMVTDESLNIIMNSHFHGERVFRQSIIYNVLKPSFLGCCMAFRREVLNRLLPFPKYGCGHDLWLGLVALRFYRFKFLDIPLIYYRRHSCTVTPGGKREKTNLWFKLYYRIYVVKELYRLIL